MIESEQPTENLQTISNAPPIQDASQSRRKIARFTKKKSKKKRLLVLGAAIAAVALVVWIALPKSHALPVSTAALVRGELVSMVSLSGTVESADATRIYSTQSGRVKVVSVHTGDPVQEGDVLAELDTSDLELAIAKQQAAMDLLVRENELALELSRQDYENLKDDLENDRDATVVSAEQALAQAEKAFTDAKQDLDEHEDELDYADEKMNDLERQLNRARAALSQAEKAYDKAKSSGDSTAISEAEAVLMEKEQAYDDALIAWNEGNTEYGGELSVYSKAYRQARLDYEKALALEEIAEKDAYRRLDALKAAAQSSEVSADMKAQQLELDGLNRQLEASTVTSPISGTVTAVYAQQGMPGSGLLFVIEDTGNLVIKTSIREYDIGSVSEGLPAVIKSDATGDAEFEGTVSRISPTAAKDSDGSTLSNTTVVFETDVALLSHDSGLRVGMNVRLNVITAKKQDVYSVPYDAVVTDAEGRTVVYRTRTEGDKTFAEAVEVSTGMENDFSLEISADSLADGDQIITDPAGLTDGSEIAVLPQGAEAVK